MKYLITGISMLALGFLTLTGELRNVIRFSDAINELGFCMLMGMGGILFTFGFFLKSKPNNG